MTLWQRIKQRPYRFIAWMFSLALAAMVVATLFGAVMFGTTDTLTYLGSGYITVIDRNMMPNSKPISPSKPTLGFHAQSLMNLPLTLKLGHAFSPPRKNANAVMIPLGFPALLLLGVTSWWFWKRLPAHPGLCKSCGYSLTGNRSGKCPECGAKAAVG